MSSPSSVDPIVRRRETAIWQGAAASVVAKAVNALCLLAQVPIALGHLGAELFGLWMTLTSILSLMAFADFGVGSGVQNEAGRLLGEERRGDLMATCVNGVAVLGLISLGLAALLLAGWRCLPWENWLGIANAAMREEARTGLLILIVIFCANFPLTAVSRFAFGVQLGWLANLWLAAIAALTLIAVYAASGLALGFASFVLVAAAPVVLGHVGLTFHVARKLDWSLRDVPYPNFGHMLALARHGLPFTLPQLGALAMTFMPPLVISAQLGPAAVTPWHLVHRLLGLFSVAQQALLTQLWPAYTEARARGDWPWMQKQYWRSVLGGVALIALPQALFFLWGPIAISAWTTDTVMMPAWFALCAGLQAAALSLGQAPSFLLNSLSRMRGQATYGFAATALALALTPTLAHTGGLAGVAGVIAVVWAVFYLPLIYLEARLASRGGVGTMKLIQPS